MAPSAVFFSIARRLRTRTTTRSPFTPILRYFSTSDPPPPPYRAPAPVMPVSYPAKPQVPSDAAAAAADEPDSKSERTQQTVRTPPERGTRVWTREEARYVRDAAGVSPVSYPSRVAPLPEDRGAELLEVGEGEGEGKGGQGQLEKEAQKIQAFGGLRNVGGQEEVEKVPFPRMIRLERRQAKSVLDLQKAIKEVKANAKRNFLETVEAHVRLGVNPRRSDQTVRGAVTLPHGTGKDVRVAVFADGAQADEARAAGADVVGGDEFIEEIRKGGGKLSFDKCISTPAYMPRLGKIARILGPRGLMPNPKLGSVTSNVSAAVMEAKCGRVDFKMDKTAIVHVGLGKVNFSEEALRENIGAFVNSLLLVKPAGLKKTSRYAGYVNSFSLSSTMGPGFPVTILSLSEAADSYNKLHPKSAS